MPKNVLAITALRGRNNVDSPLLVPDDICVEAMNVEWSASGVAKKRGGSTEISLTCSAGGPFGHPIHSLFRHIPAAVESAAELWAIDGGASGTAESQLIRLASATQWAEVTQKDAILFDGAPYANACSFNGKLFIASQTSTVVPAGSNVDRLHVWDGTSHRRVGLGTPDAPTAADTGSGSYAATIRYYKVCYTVQASGVTVRRSEPSAALTKTPSGSGTGLVVTKPATISEGETHWELYGSADASTYYLLATTVVGTTTYTDSTNPSAYSGTAIPTAGTNTVPTSWKYLATNGNRLIGAGSWVSGGKNNRVWYTAVLGSSNVGDDERVTNTTAIQNWIDLDENDGGVITGLVGQFQGVTLVFKQRQVWKLIPTGIDTAPFRAIKISSTVGAISQKSIVEADDENGQPCVYFISQRGPYRYGVGGFEYCGRDIEDLWAGVFDDGTYTNLGDKAHGIFYPKKRQVWWFFDLAGATASGTWYGVVLDTKFVRRENGWVRGGWARRSIPTGARPTASVAFGRNASGFITSDWQPHVAYYHATGTPVLLRCDTSATVDGASNATWTIRGYVTTKMYAPAGLASHFSVEEGQLVGHDANGSYTITVSTTGSLGDTNTSSVVFASATTAIKQLEALNYNQTAWVQMTIGDAAAQASNWQIDAIVVPYKPQETR